MQGDVIAGLTVGLTVIPQGLAYAAVAELPPQVLNNCIQKLNIYETLSKHSLLLQYGLYSAFMGCFIYCFFGTSKDITLGPTAIMSLMTATFCVYTFYPSHLSTHEVQTLQAYFNPVLAVMLTLFSGILQFLMGILRLGNSMKIYCSI